MWNRKELKQKAKNLLKLNYWKCVGASAVFSILSALGFSSGNTASSDSTSETMDFSNYSDDTLIAIVMVVGAILLVSTIVSLLIRIFVSNPLRVGYSAFLLSVDSNEEVTINTMFNSIKGRYGKLGWKMFTTDFICGLWGLLLFIPGVVKSYAYRMVPYILAENPDISAKEARAQSEKIMNGHKWNSFVLDLSFIGWDILSCATFGLLKLFYVDPYEELTDMELYKAIKDINI